MRRTCTRTVTAALLAVLTQACGGGSNAGPTPVPTPTPAPVCTESLLFQGGGSVPTSTLVLQSFTSTSQGRLDVILDWTFAESLIGVYVVRGGCSLDQFNARTCDFLLRSEPSTVKPRRLSRSSVPAGTYSLLVGNYSDKDESASTQIFLRSEACAPLSTTGDGEAAAWGELTRVLPY